MGTSLRTALPLGQIPLDPQSNEPSQSDKQDILCMCFSPSEEILIASTSKNQLYSITMSLTEISKVSLPQQRLATLGAKSYSKFAEHGSFSPFIRAKETPILRFRCRSTLLSSVGWRLAAASLGDTLQLSVRFKWYISFNPAVALKRLQPTIDVAQRRMLVCTKMYKSRSVFFLFCS